MEGILGEKVGMTAVFDETGMQIPVTVVRYTGTIVVGKRTEERDGYTALILGYGERRVKRISKPLEGQFAKNGLVEVREDGRKYVKRYVREFRMSSDRLDSYEIGETIDPVKVFNEGERVDVIGTSKGRGFTGVMKRHNFRGGKATHGVHEYFRHGGSIGSNTTPARVFKNRKMPGQVGNKRTTIQSLSLVRILPDEGLLLIRGGLPGPNGGLLTVQHAVKAKRF